MKHQRVAAALLGLLFCLSLCLPAAFAVDQRAELEGLTVKVRCTGSAIPAEPLTVRLTPCEDAPMPGDAEFLEVTLNTADCKKNEDQTASAVFPGIFVYTTPGQYEYEVMQERGTDENALYDTRTFIVRVTAQWEEDTFGCVVKVLEKGASEAAKKDEILFTNRYRLPDPPYIPCDPPPCPDPSEPPVTVVVTPTPVQTPVEPEKPEPEQPVSVPTVPTVPTLIQTGQLRWPVPVLTGVGAALLAAGLLLRKRDGKDDDA